MGPVYGRKGGAGIAGAGRGGVAMELSRNEWSPTARDGQVGIEQGHRRDGGRGERMTVVN